MATQKKKPKMTNDPVYVQAEKAVLRLLEFAPSKLVWVTLSTRKPGTPNMPHVSHILDFSDPKATRYNVESPSEVETYALELQGEITDTTSLYFHSNGGLKRDADVDIIHFSDDDTRVTQYHDFVKKTYQAMKNTKKNGEEMFLTVAVYDHNEQQDLPSELLGKPEKLYQVTYTPVDGFHLWEDNNLLDTANGVTANADDYLVFHKKLGWIVVPHS